jgi:DNA-binding MarR family transcriptional regulator
MEVVPAVTKIIRLEMRKHASPDMSIAHFRTLARLARGPQTNKELADWIGIGPSSMCRAVDILVKKGYAKRNNSAEDRREIQIVATARGRAKVEKVRQATREVISAHLKEISPEARENLLSGLTTLREVFHI